MCVLRMMMMITTRIFHWVLVFSCLIPAGARATKKNIVSFRDKRGNTVYLKLKAVGCFADARFRALRNYYYDGRSQIRWTDPFNKTNIIRTCAVNAYKQGFLGMFGVQYYGECWSDGFAGKRYNMYGKSSNCKHGVGKGWANMVYRYKVLKNY